MGGKSSPDYGDIAASQGEENRDVIRDQTYANRANQYTPWGYTNWTNEGVKDPATDQMTTQWSQTQGLTPELQDILNKQIAIQGGRTDLAGMLTGRMGSEFGAPMDWRGLSPAGGVPTAQYTLPEPDAGDPYATRQGAEDAVYNQASSRLDPQFAGKRNEMEINLRNRGIGPEDEVWKSQMQGLGQQENDARNQAMWSANQAGRDEAGQMYGQQMGRQAQNFGQAATANNQNYNQSMQGSQYANQIRQQQITEQLQQRGSSLNEINALLSGQQVQTPQMPNFAQAGAAQPAPLYQAGVAQGNYDQAQNPMNGLMGLAGTLGGAALSRGTP
jgi:hypothetical protein